MIKKNEFSIIIYIYRIYHSYFFINLLIIQTHCFEIDIKNPLIKNIEMKKALLIVDVQNDFCPGGALGIKEGNQIVPIINTLMDKVDIVIATQDWHPQDSTHFQKWPVHCVAETKGAELNPELNKNKINQFALKGTGQDDPGYSAFDATNISLSDYLNLQNVGSLYVVGLATDYCVRASALDASRLGFHTYVVTDAIAAVDLEDGDGRKALDEMYKAGCILVDSTEV